LFVNFDTIFRAVEMTLYVLFNHFYSDGILFFTVLGSVCVHWASMP